MSRMLSMAAVMTGDSGDSNTYLILGGLCSCSHYCSGTGSSGEKK